MEVVGDERQEIFTDRTSLRKIQLRARGSGRGRGGRGGGRRRRR
jgi:hypothetical protein